MDLSTKKGDMISEAENSNTENKINQMRIGSLEVQFQVTPFL